MDTQPTRRTVDIRRETKRCPTCGQRFSGEAAFCPFDGAKLEKAAYEPLVDPLIGTTVDARYEVVELLGEGGMGQVYEVRHIALDRRFAMKALRRDLARDEELSGRFIQEAKATASVRHPNVVQITDFGKLPSGAPYFVMELLVGQSLGQVIKAGGPIPTRRALRIIRQVAGALAVTHAAGIVHRDLKPDNIFLVGGMSGGTASDDVRVVDFGAAKIIGSSRVTRQGIVFGTPHYMSPEQASGQPVDRRADIYALGVIMYEMFTGRVPFEADTYMGVLTQHMFVQPVPPSKVNPAGRELGALEDITLVCLAKKPEERYGSMEELSAVLDEVVQSHSDGHIEIANRLSTRPSRPAPAVRYRMADELEPPSLEEMRISMAAAIPGTRVLPRALAVGALAVLAVAACAWLWFPRRIASGPPPDAVTLTVGQPAPPPAPSAAAPLPTLTASTASAVTASAPSSSGATPAVASARRPAPKKPPPPGPGIDDLADPFAAKR